VFIRTGDYESCLKYIDVASKNTMDNLLLSTLLQIYTNTLNTMKAIETFDKFRNNLDINAENYEKIIILTTSVNPATALEYLKEAAAKKFKVSFHTYELLLSIYTKTNNKERISEILLLQQKSMPVH